MKPGAEAIWCVHYRLGTNLGQGWRNPVTRTVYRCDPRMVGDKPSLPYIVFLRIGFYPVRQQREAYKEGRPDKGGDPVRFGARC